jgi:RHS repeat-associated protein
MRVAGAVYWLHGDHLGSASLTTDVSGQKVAEMRYLPFGATRWMSGMMPTDRRYTGQREVPAIGLHDYNARMYWPAAGRFVSADTVVPGPDNPQQFNRYTYVLNSPLVFNDPTGHAPSCSAAPELPGCDGAKTTWIDVVVWDYYNEVSWLQETWTPEQWLAAYRVGLAYASERKQSDNTRLIAQGMAMHLAGGNNVRLATLDSLLAIGIQAEVGRAQAYADATGQSLQGIATLMGYAAYRQFLGHMEMPGSLGMGREVGVGEYLAKKAPRQVAPGVRVLNGQYLDDLGRVQPWVAHYDQYGRLIARTDYNAGDPAQGIANVHHHVYRWGPGMTPLEVQSHVPGEYRP